MCKILISIMPFCLFCMCEKWKRKIQRRTGTFLLIHWTVGGRECQALICSCAPRKDAIELVLPKLTEPWITWIVERTKGEVVIVKFAIVWRVNPNGNTALSFFLHTFHDVITVCPSITKNKKLLNWIDPIF